MNKQQLQDLRDDIAEAVDKRKTLGEFDANSYHMMLLLRSILALTDHAIATQAKPKKK